MRDKKKVIWTPEELAALDPAAEAQPAPIRPPCCCGGCCGQILPAVPATEGGNDEGDDQAEG